ncbi:MAG TPA: hypothetical protein VK899_08520 [Gemmatimonadales bacterium]|nr:hypothetical protein [Gemmatimonadales bacterium]
MDDRFDDLLRDSAREYNDPPETPREELWQRIVAAREADKQAPKEKTEDEEPLRVLPFRRLPRIRPNRPLTWAAGVAAVLALGIGLGRMSVKQPPTVAVSAPVPSSAPAPRVTGAAYRVATTEHLSQSEAFLTLFRASVRGKAGNERLASATARQLLATNRLLLDSPAAADARTRLLLQDLELVLAEIAQLSPQPRSRDLQLITEGLEQGGVLSRLRTAVPAGTSATQGAL